MSLSIAQKGLIMVAVPLVMNLGILAGLDYLIARANRLKQQEERVNAITQHADDVRRLFYAAISTGFKVTLSADEKQLDQYKQIRRKIEENNNALMLLEADVPKQRQLLEHMHLLEVRALKVFDAAASATQQGRQGFTLFRELQVSYEFQALAMEFAAEIEKFIATESSRGSEAHAGWDLPLKLLLGSGFAANCGLSICLALFFGRNFADRLKTMIDNTLRLASDQPLHPLVPGDDEIASLDSAYHAMADVLGEARLKERVFIDNALDIICTIDDKRKFTDVSPVCQEVWGYSPADLIGRSVLSITADAEVASATFPEMSEESGEERERNFENRIKHKDGRLVDMLWATHWFRNERTYFCVAHDITARKQAQRLLKESEARILTVIENLPVGLMIHDAEGKIELTNQKADQMLVVAKGELLNHDRSRYLAPRLQPESASSVEAFSAIRSDGRSVPIDLHISDLYYQGQEKKLSIMVDVSERLELEKARKELVHMVSHDLRTPLNSVEAVMELMVSGVLGPLTASRKEMAQISTHELHRLLALLNGLLDLEKIQAGALVLEREVNSSGYIADQTFSACADLAKKSNIALVNEAKECELLCDGDRLIEVMVLCVMDAVRQDLPPAKMTIFADQVAGAIEFKVMAQFQTEGTALATTESVEESRLRASDAGLWLVIARGIVAAHNGTLELTGSKDAGQVVYTFTIALPESGEEGAE